jgi:hypothetical protein
MAREGLIRYPDRPWAGIKPGDIMRVNDGLP